MNEDYQVNSVETEDVSEVTTSEYQDAFNDAWDGDGLTEVYEFAESETEETSAEEPEADQPTEEHDTDNDNETAPESDAEPAEDEAGKADQLFTLKHLDEVKEINLSDPAGREEAVALMQKGMDYDRKTSKITEQNEKIAEYEEFLTELATPMGLNINELMDNTRARIYKDSEERAGREISESDALLKVQRDRAAKKRQAEEDARAAETKRSEDANSKMNEAIRLFMSEYPEVKSNDIPQNVWDEAVRTGDLVGAYTRYENGKLKAEIETLKQNKKNADRSTGSRKSAGAGTKKSPFDKGWDDI